jgi:hypothetical protein
MQVSLPSILSLSLKEAIHPFYLFQVASITLWILEDYLLYAFIILSAATLSAVSTVYQIRVNASQLRDLARMEGKVKVVRELDGRVSESREEEEIEKEREVDDVGEGEAEREESPIVIPHVEDDNESEGEGECVSDEERRGKLFLCTLHLEDLVPGDVILLEDQMVCR